MPSVHGLLHHVELWVPDIERTRASLGWLLTELGYTISQEFGEGTSWKLGATYIVAEQSPALTSDVHERLRPGLNHLAFHVSDAATLDALVAGALEHGWSLLFADEHPFAGGEGYRAGYLEDADGFEVELVVSEPEAQ